MVNFLLVQPVKSQNPGLVLRGLVENLVAEVAKQPWVNNLPQDFVQSRVLATQVAEGIRVKTELNNGGPLAFQYDDAAKAADRNDFKNHFNKLVNGALEAFVDGHICYPFFDYADADKEVVELILSSVDNNIERFGIMVERNDGKEDFGNYLQVGELSSEVMAGFFKDIVQVNAGGGAAVAEPPKKNVFAGFEPVGAPAEEKNQELIAKQDAPKLSPKQDIAKQLQEALKNQAPVVGMPKPVDLGQKQNFIQPQPQDFQQEADMGDDVKAKLLKALKAQKAQQLDPNAVPDQKPVYQPPKNKQDEILGALAKALEKKRSEEEKIAARKALENPNKQNDIRKKLIDVIEARKKAEENARLAKLAPIRDQLAEAVKQQEQLLVGSPAFENQVPAFQQEFHGLQFNAQVDENDKDIQAAKAVLEELNNPQAPPAAPAKKAKPNKALGAANDLLGKLGG